MAFIANLTQSEKDILYSALYNHFVTNISPNILNIPNIPNIPTFTPLTPSMNATAEENVRNRLNDLLVDDNIVESPGTLSLLVITRVDRYFFIRYNDRVYKISTNSDLSEIYNVCPF